MQKTVDLIMVGKCGLNEVVAKVSLSSGYEPKDKEIFTINLYETKLTAIYFVDDEENEKITILHEKNHHSRQEIMGKFEKVNDFNVLKELLEVWKNKRC